jgi:hypothetical protein
MPETSCRDSNGSVRAAPAYRAGLPSMALDPGIRAGMTTGVARLMPVPESVPVTVETRRMVASLGCLVARAARGNIRVEAVNCPFLDNGAPAVRVDLLQAPLSLDATAAG